MSAGTITLTNGTNQITGSGTAFLTDSAAGDMIVAVVGGVTYTLPVKSIESDTTLTTTLNYDGPTQSGSAWTNVPRNALNSITAQLGAEAARAMRGLNLDKQNWQNVYSASGNITVTLPDGSTFAGPSWNSITTSVANKLDKSEVSSTGLKIISAANTSEARSALELGDSATKNTGTTTGTVAAGDDSRLGTVNGKTGGAITSSVNVEAGNNFMVNSAGTAALNRIFITNKNAVPDPATYAGYFQADSGSGFMQFGPTRSGAGNLFSTILTVKQDGSTAASAFTFWPNGNADATNWRSTSDPRLKDIIGFVDSPLEKMRQIRGYTWKYKKFGSFGIGFLTTDVKKVFPDAVSSNEFVKETLPDGTVVESPESLDLSGVSAGLHHEAILALMDKVEQLEIEIKSLRGSV